MITITIMRAMITMTRMTMTTTRTPTIAGVPSCAGAGGGMETVSPSSFGEQSGGVQVQNPFGYPSQSILFLMADIGYSMVTPVVLCPAG